MTGRNKTQEQVSVHDEVLTMKIYLHVKGTFFIKNDFNLEI